MYAIVLSKLFFLLCYFIRVNCCFLVNNVAINFVIIAIVFVLYETIILKLFYLLMNSSLKLSNLG